MGVFFAGDDEHWDVGDGAQQCVAVCAAEQDAAHRGGVDRGSSVWICSRNRRTSGLCFLAVGPVKADRATGTS